MVVHRGPPGLGGARVAPVLLTRRDRLLQRHGDGRHLGGPQVAAVFDGAAVLYTFGPCLCEGDYRVAAQADHRWFAADVEALAPRPARASTRAAAADASQGCPC